jgi:threonine aldolase
MRTVDLRSDSVTQATPEMRRAMAEAVVGDDGREGDPTTQRLEKLSAEFTGQEAALFVASGTMGNLVALMTHLKPGEEVMAEREAHILRFEAGGVAAIVGAIPRGLKGEAGRLDLDEVEAEIQPPSRHRPRTGLIEIENTHNGAGGTVLDAGYIRELCGLAHAHHVPVHMDGERVFHAAVALGVATRELTRDCDSVMFGLSKGLGAPFGSMLCGSEAFVARARDTRQRVGGGMRQSGHMAAAGIVALETMVDRLAEDHAKARRLAEGIAAARAGLVDLARVQTNIVLMQTGPLGRPADQMVREMAAAGVGCLPVGPETVRFVTHYGVSGEDIEYAIETIGGRIK